MKPIIWLVLIAMNIPAVAGAAEVPVGNYDKGKLIFASRCAVCHTIEKGRANTTGPNLYGVVGSKTGFAENYAYTAANKNKGIIWNTETLSEYLINPGQYIPGTKMVFAGLKKAQDRADIIEYLKQFKD
ncbi:c-type cytochrome [Pseudomonas sp. WHRI 8519]|uniref:c-type cytochrome n=1 Tax=Pseudomonas sp. WHRI 8519 TaxID=3162567 RepID=UPI0032F05FF5